MRLKFAEWLFARLSQDQPPSAGNPDETGTNADRNFGSTGARSKTMASTVPAGLSNFNPDKKYGKKRRKG